MSNPGEKPGSVHSGLLGSEQRGEEGSGNSPLQGSGQRGERGTMHGREAFMQNIASRLGRPQPLATAPERREHGVPEHYKAISLTQEEKVDLFIQNWTALSGKVLVVKGEEAGPAISAYLQEVCRELGVSRATMWDHEPLAALGLEPGLAQAGVALVPWRELAADGGKLGTDAPGAAAEQPQAAQTAKWAQRSALLRAAERCQIGIVWPDYAIANTSTLTLLAQGGKGRSVSLLPDILFAVFRANQLVTRMGEMFQRVREDHPDPVTLPSSLNMITGPSRSADIENDLTIGIHGPGKVYAVIIE
ncbi:L-lactate dehydrogenase complex protein LldG [Paenibacillus sp. GP183]|nr:L-lactate dehydrogenase complex protein LldG [Paenibacillus sp. GP183]